MEIAKREIAAVQEATNQATADMQELDDLELMLVGGGSGDISLG